MSILIEGRSAPSAGNRLLPEARKDKWLQELERALLSGAARQMPAAERAPQSDPVAAAGVAQQASPDAGGGAATAPRIQPVFPRHVGRTTPDAEPAQARQPVPVGAAAAEVTQDEVGGAASTTAARNVSHGATGQGSAPPHLGALAGYGGAVRGVAGAVPFSGAVPAGPVPARASPAIVYAAPQTAPSRLAPSALSGAARDQEALHGAAADGGPEKAELPASTEETYGARHMHLYRSADGVHAWIRDATLAPAHSAMLMASLAAEMSASGQRLLSLTVNGRRAAAAGTPDGTGTGKKAWDADPHDRIEHKEKTV